MRKAFGKEGGPLTDPQAQVGEREGIGHLFAGAIACFKNPSSHRGVVFTAEEAAELVLFAGHLIRIVEGRRAARTNAP